MTPCTIFPTRERIVLFPVAGGRAALLLALVLLERGTGKGIPLKKGLGGVVIGGGAGIVIGERGGEMVTMVEREPTTSEDGSTSTIFSSCSL